MFEAILNLDISDRKNGVDSATKQEDTNTRLEDEDQMSADGDPTAALQNLQPNIPKDYELFLNLVEFCKRVLRIEDKKEKDNPIPERIKQEPINDADTSALKGEEGFNHDSK